MPPDPSEGAKICSVCGIDCTGKPRVKDAQGRYMCKDCLDKAKSTRQALATPPKAEGAAAAAPAKKPAEDDNSFLLNIGSKPSLGTVGSRPCPECGRALDNDTVVCVSCGYNMQTGKRLGMKVVKAKQLKEPKSGGGGGFSLDLSPGLIGGVLLVVFGICFALAFADPVGLLIYVGLYLVFGLVVWVYTLVEAFKESFADGLASLICGFYALYFVFVKSDNEMLKWMYGLNILLIAGMYILRMAIATGGGPPVGP